MKPTTRIQIAMVVQLVAVMFSFMTWIDPLEGGVAMALATGISGFAWIIGRVPLPKFTWISATAGLALMVIFWVIYISEIPADPSEATTFVPSTFLLSLLWIYRVAAVAFISGAVFYLVVQFTALRAAGQPGDSSRTTR